MIIWLNENVNDNDGNWVMIKCNYVICGEKNIIFITKTVHNRKTDIAQSVERLLHYVLAMGKGSIKTSIIIISPTINEFQSNL